MAIYSRLKRARVTLPVQQGDYIYVPMANDTNAGLVHFNQLVKIVAALPEDLTDLNGRYYLCNNVLYVVESGAYRTIADLDSVTKLSDDTETTEIDYLLGKAIDKTFRATDIVSVTVRIPDDIEHGFYAAINVKTSNSTVPFTFINNSTYPLQLRDYGLPATGHTASAHAVTTVLFYCDGINIYGYISEVHD